MVMLAAPNNSYQIVAELWLDSSWLWKDYWVAEKLFSSIPVTSLKKCHVEWGLVNGLYIMYYQTHIFAKFLKWLKCCCLCTQLQLLSQDFSSPLAKVRVTRRQEWAPADWDREKGCGRGSGVRRSAKAWDSSSMAHHHDKGCSGCSCL